MVGALVNTFTSSASECDDENIVKTAEAMKELLTQNLVQDDQTTSVEDLVKCLQELRKDYFTALEAGKSPREANEVAQEKAHKRGALALKIIMCTNRSLAAAAAGIGSGGLSIAGGMLTNPITWGFGGLMLAL